MRHIISVLLENEPGALSRVVGLFSARGYNIETLTVAPTEDETMSRMTIVTVGSDDIIEQITKHLNRLIEVVKVVDLSDGAHIERELMLVKLRAVGKEREELKRTADIFRGRIIDVTEKSYTIELTGDAAKLDAFIEAIDRAAILETVRTGTSGIGRGEQMHDRAVAQMPRRRGPHRVEGPLRELPRRLREGDRRGAAAQHRRRRAVHPRGRRVSTGQCLDGLSAIAWSRSSLGLENQTLGTRCSLRDATEARVVISGIKTGVRGGLSDAAADDATCPSIARTDRLHGVLAVVAPGMGRQQTLPVAEHRAVLLVRERPALADQAEGVHRLFREFVDPHHCSGIRSGVGRRPFGRCLVDPSADQRGGCQKDGEP